MARIKQRHAVAFFPWLNIEKPIKMGKYTLIAYKQLIKEKRIKNTKIINQLNAIFKGFVSNLTAFIESEQTIDNPVIILKGTRFSLFTTEEDNDLFHLRNIMAFICISINDRRKSENKYRHFDPYFNSSIFDLVIQGFTLESEGVAFSIRRRYGRATITGLRKYNRFIMPNHTSFNPLLKFDLQLKKTFSKVLRHYRDNDNSLRLLAALDWFFSAHTDSSIVKDRSDIAMMGTSFEILLQIPYRNKAVEMMNHIRTEFSGFTEIKHNFNRRTAIGGSILVRNRSWKEHWICRFYEERNKVVHSKEPPSLDWSHNAHFKHLEIADIIFDLLVKLFLSKDGFYKLNRNDKAECNALDEFLSSDNLSIEDIADKQERIRMGMVLLKKIEKKAENQIEKVVC